MAKKKAQKPQKVAPKLSFLEFVRFYLGDKGPALSGGFVRYAEMEGWSASAATLAEWRERFEQFENRPIPSPK